MNTFPSPLIEVSELQSILESTNLILIDASGGPEAKIYFEKQHIKGAFYIDLETDLSSIGKNAAIGGRHPLPNPEDFAKTLVKFGISPESHVVIYDFNNCANSASRFWWMLKAFGHDKVQVLNGGFKAALEFGIPISSGFEETLPLSNYPVSDWKLPLADINEVELVSKKEDFIVIDVRAKERYDGFVEPIDLIAGHIPGAINIPLTENLDENGKFLNKDVLKKMYSERLNNTQEEKVIIHCGSGVSACHTILAMVYAGFEFPKLYVGSWSEWSRNEKEITIL